MNVIGDSLSELVPAQRDEAIALLDRLPWGDIENSIADMEKCLRLGWRRQ